MSLYERLWEETLIAVMDGIVSSVRRCDEILWVENIVITMSDVIRRHRVHMMDDDPIIDLITFDSQIQTLITGNHLVTNMLPLSGSVESLIHVTLEAKSRSSNLSSELEIVISFLERVDPSQFRI